ncbi:uncharacterized protein OCT59_009913 [Rhizophagus irregularis]|uniref:Uncharacterized protein n=3 Tax=Rhizophagus irregularis TaxID=588596 RepID=A0A015K5B5_RHIIW|nr:hypothetical protein RirG_028080 [Rhizophagus irregularis DAOM 197198w]UZO18601.1 hypothetical protein OCT59_009913 [Rhizophagus irregularis]GBC29315.2 hypothetical protein GLOIN_2v1732713 [Rhizophagus irregularis DAOM 181602=DAOM 197198]CAG8626824.1 14237_t:CDS:1 [Rhizophagus irregularis]
MWEFETNGTIKHILRIDENPSSMNKWLIFITIFSSILEAVLVPVLILSIWLIIYKVKRKMNGCEFRLCMQATHSSMFKLFIDLFSRYDKSSKGMLVFIMLLLIMNLLGKNIPNILVANVIGIHNFTKIVHHNMDLFKNDLNCTYVSCTSDLEDNNFALVLNSTTLENTMRTHNVKTAYWDLSNNNTLDAIRIRVNTTSCNFTIGDGIDSVVSNNLGNVTDVPAQGRFTGSYGGLSTVAKRDVVLGATPTRIFLTTDITDRCDIPLNMFYISPNFEPNVYKMANWLVNDSGYHTDQAYNRTCRMKMECIAIPEWKKMKIVGNTPDNIKLSEVNFNNSLDKLKETFSNNVSDYNVNGKAFGERLVDEIMIKMQTITTNWREIIKFQGNTHNYNFLDEYERVISQSLVSSIQSMSNNINVDVDEIEKLEAPGLWIEIAILTLVTFFVCSILLLIFTTRNEKMLLPLSPLDFGIVSNAIFKEDSTKTSWPFELDYSHQDKSKHLVTANEVN